MSIRPLWMLLTILGIGFLSSLQAADAVDWIQLDASNRAQWLPGGKEVDAIAGDYVLRNSELIAVIANPVAGRNANMSAKDVGGQIIDLTTRASSNDQLTAFYACPSSAALRTARFAKTERGGIEMICANQPTDGAPEVQVIYTLEPESPTLRVQTRVTNLSGKAIAWDRVDTLRTDKTFHTGDADSGALLWSYDVWFDQAYGILPDGLRGEFQKLKSWMGPIEIRYGPQADDFRVMLQPAGTLTYSRYLWPARHPLTFRSVNAGEKRRHVRLQVTDPDGPVNAADVWVTQNSEPYATGRTDAQGWIQFMLPHGEFGVRVFESQRGKCDFKITGDQPHAAQVDLPAPGYVKAHITDAKGAPIPCKVQFVGAQGTATPDFFVDSGDHAVKNCYYSHDGVFRQAIAPGQYDVIISYGPEHDAVFTAITVERGRDTALQAKLVHTVDTTGWISGEFHSHSSPSGDNTSSQLGRVLNLLCEQIDFAPCTEHQRIDSYAPILESLSVTARMATCTGMELTGSPGDINHQNAFPLRYTPFTQDGGGPTTDSDPLKQIQRLALWDDGAEKLVQQNHPNLIRYARDKNLDGKGDGGYAEMFGHMDVIEVHPLEAILKPATIDKDKKINTGKNRIHAWLQLINDGLYIPGVVNTDAHYNFHGSGWRRNWIPSKTDDPAQIQTLDVVHACERGQMVMSTGPFMEVTVSAADHKVGPGETILKSGGDATIHVRVQCPNWFDIDRVQILVNGRAVPEYNFTRTTHADHFGQTVVKFDQTIPVKLTGDAHLIVVAVGDHSTLGPVMGPGQGKLKPIAVSNPVFMDVDGDGKWTANKDTLDAPLP